MNSQQAVLVPLPANLFLLLQNVGAGVVANNVLGLHRVRHAQTDGLANVHIGANIDLGEERNDSKQTRSDTEAHRVTCPANFH